jgi:hypothetical protein
MPTASRARVISPLVGEAMAQEAVKLRIEEFRERARRSPPGRTPGVYPPVPPQNRAITSAIVITFAAMLAAYVIRETRTPNRPKSER